MGSVCKPPGGGTKQNFVGGVSTLRSNPLPNLVPRVLSYPPYGARERALRRAGRRDPGNEVALYPFMYHF